MNNMIDLHAIKNTKQTHFDGQIRSSIYNSITDTLINDRINPSIIEHTAFKLKKYAQFFWTFRSTQDFKGVVPFLIICFVYFVLLVKKKRMQAKLNEAKSNLFEQFLRKIIFRGNSFVAHRRQKKIKINLKWTICVTQISKIAFEGQFNEKQ